MTMDLGTLRAYVDLDTSKFDGGMGKVTESVKTFGGKVPGWMGTGTAAIVAGAAVAGAALYSIGDTFDNVEDTIRVGTGAMGEDLDALTQSAKNVGTSVPAAWEDVGQTVADVNTRLGLTGPALETVSSQFLELGRILDEDIDIQGTTGALSAFHIEGDAVSGSLDTLYQISQATGIGFNDLASRVASAAPITQQLGFTFEETAGMIGAMDKAGLDSQTMIGAMQKGLAGMTEPGQDASETFRNVVGDIQGFIDSGDDAAARDLAGQLFGTRGAAQFVGALQSGAVNMEDLANVAGMTSDTILGAGEDTQDFAEKWQLVQNNAMAALEPLASMVFTALGDALTAVMPYLTVFADWLADNPIVLQAVAAVIGVLAAAFVGLTIATWAMNTALLANPITWIVLGIVALIAAVILLWMNWDQVVAWISEAWAGFIGWISGVIDGFVGWWNDTWNTLVAAWHLTWAMIFGFVEDVWNGFVGWITGVVTGYIAWWMSVWSAVSTFFSDLWSGIVGFVTDAWNNVMSFLGGIPQAIMDVFAGAASWLYGIGEDILNGLWDGLLSIWNGLVDWIAGIGQSIADTFAGVLDIHSPSRVFMRYGVDTMQGYVNGVESMEGEVAKVMGSIAPTPEMLAVGSGSATAATTTAAGNTRVVHYHAAENQSLSSEEALYAALGSPRVREAA